MLLMIISFYFINDLFLIDILNLSILLTKQVKFTNNKCVTNSYNLLDSVFVILLSVIPHKIQFYVGLA